MIGRVNAGGGSTEELQSVTGTISGKYSASTVTLTGIPFKPKFYRVYGYYTFDGDEQCGDVWEERGLGRMRYTAGEDTGGNGNYYVEANTGTTDFIGATYNDGTLTITVSPALHQPTNWIVWG